MYFHSDGGHPHIHHYYNYHPPGPPGRMHHVRISIGAPSGTIVNVSCIDVKFIVSIKKLKFLN